MENIVFQIVGDIWTDVRTSGLSTKILYLLLIVFLASLFSRKMREAFKEYLIAIHAVFAKTDIIDWYRISLFKNERYLIERARDIEFDDEAKTYLFTTILAIKIEITINEIRKYIDDLVGKRKLKIKKEDLIAELRILLEMIVSNYENAIKMEFIKKYGQDIGSKVFNCVYYGRLGDKKKYGFKQYHEKNLQIIHKGLQGSLETPIGKPDYMLYNFLINVHTALTLALNDLASVFKNFNGELTQLVNESKQLDIQNR